MLLRKSEGKYIYSIYSKKSTYNGPAQFKSMLFKGQLCFSRLPQSLVLLHWTSLE